MVPRLSCCPGQSILIVPQFWHWGVNRIKRRTREIASTLWFPGSQQYPGDCPLKHPLNHLEPWQWFALAAFLGAPSLCGEFTRYLKYGYLLSTCGFFLSTCWYVWIFAILNLSTINGLGQVPSMVPVSKTNLPRSWAQGGLFGCFQFQ